MNDYDETLARNRATWPKGPWTNEPDRVEWKTKAGLPALIVRNPVMGNLCGYVAVPPGHPWHGRHYGDGIEVAVHGGLTYGDECADHICHVPEPGEPDDVWWLGFDCGHAGDAMPGLSLYPALRATKDAGYTYKDIDYVRDECERLAEQASRASKEARP